MTPDQFTLEEKMLEVSDGHQLYVQLWGNAEAAETFIWLHGGPGSGSSDKHKTLFDPLRHRVILYDQRGCGKSLPYGSLEHNDTDAAVADVSRVADDFGADKFTLVGGSWGSFLALTYAIRNPERVNRLVIRGVWTARQSEIDFVDKGECRAFFPELWDDFVASVPPEFRDNPADYHQKQIFSGDAEAAKRSAYAYSQLEGSLLRLDDRPGVQDYDSFDPVGTIIEQHFIANGCFVPEGYILDNTDKLTMPVDIVQGRYDVICPPITAYELHKKIPGSRLLWTVGGHSGMDRANWESTKAIL